MNVDLFDFELPDSRIALRPATPRDSARMLVVEPAQWLDRTIADLAEFLRAGDVVVANDTKVIPARLVGVRVRDGNQARMTVTLHKREGLDRWRAFVKPAKKLHLDETVLFDPARTEDGLSARVVEKADGGEVVFVFNRSGAALDSAIAQWGSMPLPPISRPTAQRMMPTGMIIKPCLPRMRVRLPPLRRACISRLRSGRRSSNAGPA